MPRIEAREGPAGAPRGGAEGVTGAPAGQDPGQSSQPALTEDRHARRRKAAAELAARAGELGLAGAIGPTQDDQWRDGRPSESAKRRIAELRTASRARVLEATDSRRTSTALSWFADFTADTERVPFVDPEKADEADRGSGRGRALRCGPTRSARTSGRYGCCARGKHNATSRRRNRAARSRWR
eukprot:5430905-Pleurochrysis_carterae.AAC.1